MDVGTEILQGQTLLRSTKDRKLWIHDLATSWHIKEVRRLESIMENKKLLPKEKMMCSLCSEAKQKIRSRPGEASKYGNFITFFSLQKNLLWMTRWVEISYFFGGEGVQFFWEGGFLSSFGGEGESSCALQVQERNFLPIFESLIYETDL